MNSSDVNTTLPLDGQLGLRATDALLMVDVQRDFLPGGALAVADGDAIIPPANAYMTAFSARGLPIAMTRDWHPPDHCSFQPQGGPWPPHCVRDTLGADWPANLEIPPGSHVVSKAMAQDRDAYSGFDGTALEAMLRELGVTRVFVAGLATDYCVRATVLDARKLGFEAVVLADAVRGVEAHPGDSARALDDMTSHGATLFRPLGN